MNKSTDPQSPPDSDDTSAKSPPPFGSHFTPPFMNDAMRQSAHQIWLAGMGAFAKAQEEGSKAFEKLVKDGASMQEKAQAAASEASKKMSDLAESLNQKAAQQVNGLESMFQDRVARALERLGVPSQDEVLALQNQVDALTKRLLELEGKEDKKPTK
jgi:poly(hydroxyalkanoate) granule-associated protein